MFDVEANEQLKHRVEQSCGFLKTISSNCWVRVVFANNIPRVRKLRPETIFRAVASHSVLERRFDIKHAKHKHSKLQKRVPGSRC